MPSNVQRTQINQHLTFLALGAFLIAFVGARIFTTLFPHTVVITGGIHFHHFWYGLGMIVTAGWLGIISTQPTHKRAYAILFGLGVGLVGDEVGLLLTLGNYYSDLTYFVVVGFATLLALSYLVFRVRSKLKKEIYETSLGETLLHWGILIAGLSVLALSIEAYFLGVAVLTGGFLLAAVGYYLNKKNPHLTLRTVTGRTAV